MQGDKNDNQSKDMTPEDTEVFYVLAQIVLDTCVANDDDIYADDYKL